MLNTLKQTLNKSQLRLRGKGGRFDYLGRLIEWQWLAPEACEQLQRERLCALLAHAATQVPYYRKILRETEVVDADRRVRLDRFHSLPLLDKSIIRESFDDLKSADLDGRQWHRNTSGGSTGEPAVFIQDSEYRAWCDGFKALADLWTGFQQGEPKIVLWGSHRDLFDGREAYRVRVSRWLQNTAWLNALRMGPAEMREHLETINRLKPTLILAYVESIYELARFVASEGLPVHAPRAIMAAAGTLYPAMRETVERTFRTQVFNHYGSREASGIASECDRHSGLHVSPMTYYVELLRPDGSPAAPGEIGEVVLTSLVNYAMPLIRYRIGDTAIWSEKPCPCGRAWPLLETVTGRVSDIFVGADGSLVRGGFFTQLLYFHDWVEKFQVVQDAQEQIRIRVVPREAADSIARRHGEEMKTIEEKIRFVMGPSCRVAWEWETEIAPTASGKHRYTISHVAR